MATCVIRLAFDRAGASAVRLCIAAAMVIRETCQENENIGYFGLWPTFAKKCQQRVMTIREGTGRRRTRRWILASDDRWLDRWRLELAWFTGQPLLRSRGAGAILRFERVRPRRSGAFQPLRDNEITPQFLDRAIRALKRWKYDFLGMDEVCRRAVTLSEKRRFVALTFDGAGKDLISFAYPVLARHGVPFTVYVPTAFPDGVGQAWWLGLEQVIARESRVSLLMGDREQRFAVTGNAEKQALFLFLEG